MIFPLYSALLKHMRGNVSSSGFPNVGERWTYWTWRREGSRGDLINMYKYLMERKEEEEARLFSLVPTDRTRGNGHKLKPGNSMVSFQQQFWQQLSTFHLKLDGFLVSSQCECYREPTLRSGGLLKEIIWEWFAKGSYISNPVLAKAEVHTHGEPCA
ncbi:hypothetical protein QYF61_010354 [Mycteria americana]|uniref:Uncharacterized protein n=1 Tax=Mycteria americana TaxID=33587 RepID=A0AAN7S323_MYCAM|nr:hypothetical protein QYF61_010354 [Mycteria americana]